MKTIYFLTFCIVFILLSGCSTSLKYTMNNHNFLTPETKGKSFKGDVGISLQTTHLVYLESAFDPIIFNNSSVYNLDLVTVGTKFSIPINLGLLERLDFYSIDSKYGFKVQVLGDPQIKKTEGYKGAIAFAYGDDHPENANLLYTGTAGSQRYYNTNLRIKSYECSLLFGNRIAEKYLIYSNIFYDYYKYDGDLTSSQFASVSSKGQSYNLGMLFGFELSNNDFPFAIIKLESGIVQGKLDKGNRLTSGTFGGSVSIGW